MNRRIALPMNCTTRGDRNIGRLSILLSLLGFTMLSLTACGDASAGQDTVATPAAGPVKTRAPLEARPVSTPGVAEADARVYVLKPSADTAASPGPASSKVIADRSEAPKKVGPDKRTPAKVARAKKP